MGGTICPGNNRETLFTYDNLYRKTNETWKTGTTTNQTYGFTYDAIGNLTAVADSSSLGTTLQFTYDARNQLQLERQTPKALGVTAFILDRDYDAKGNLANTSLNIGGTIDLNPLNPSGTISGGIDDLANQYVYDNLNRLTSVSQSAVSGGNAVAPKLAAFTYNVASQMTDIRRYANSIANAPDLEVHSRYAYDGAARLSSLTHAKSEIAVGQAWDGTSVLPASIAPTQTIAAYNLIYDRDNRLTTFASYTDRFKTVFTYDNTDQLATATSSQITGLLEPSPTPTPESYSVDNNGNRKILGGASQSASFTHNQLQTDGTFNYTYDNEGNLTSKTALVGGAVTQYIWDHRNRLGRVWERASLATPVTKETLYIYDAFDRKTLDRLDSDYNVVLGANQTDVWINDGDHPLLQVRDSDGIGTVQPFRINNRFLYGDAVDQILADEQYINTVPVNTAAGGPLVTATVASAITGSTYWTVADHLGSVRDLVDNNGFTRQHVVYDSFGKRLTEVDKNAAGEVIPSTNSAAVDTIFGYTGREWDKDTNLQNNRARWYDPATGRWLSQDPIGFEAGDG